MGGRRDNFYAVNRLHSLAGGEVGRIFIIKTTLKLRFHHKAKIGYWPTRGNSDPRKAGVWIVIEHNMEIQIGILSVGIKI